MSFKELLKEIPAPVWVLLTGIITGVGGWFSGLKERKRKNTILEEDAEGKELEARIKETLFEAEKKKKFLEVMADQDRTIEKLEAQIQEMTMMVSKLKSENEGLRADYNFRFTMGYIDEIKTTKR